MQEKVTILIAAAAMMFFVIGGLSLLAHYYTLNGIKSRTVGDGQHGTARFATKKEIQQTYRHILFRPKSWRKGQALPSEQGVILGSEGKKNEVTALVDTDDVHTLMIGASGVGKTAFFLYPNLEYACATGMSFLCTDTKGDLFRNYGAVARDYYGYNIAVIDLRNPTRSDGNNLLHLVNKYMDEYRADENSLAAKAKAEKYAKIISKTIINSSGDSANYGQNAFFYDAAEGLLTSVILLLAEFLPPDDDHPEERRHIISVFKMVQELLEPSRVKGKSQFQLLMAKLPPEHKAKWFAGAALNSAEQAMASVMSTVLSRLNAFLDSEMEQILCFDTAIDAEKFCNTKSAIFIVLPEEDLTKYFMVSLMIQQLYREILSVADEQGGKLKNRVVFYCDELGTIPPIESLELIFSASRSRRLMMVPIIQSFGQLQKNYGKEGSEIIVDNCQCTIFGGFAPNSQTAEVLSKALGSRTVMSGSISRGKNDPSQSLQMMERPLMMPDELKSLPKGQFVVMKTGTHPMQTRLRLFLDWGITFDRVYEVPEKAARKVAYADKDELERRIMTRYHADRAAEDAPTSDQRVQNGMSHMQSNYSLRESKSQQRAQSQEDKR
jgi:type IV secretion system protein VirD4